MREYLSTLQIRNVSCWALRGLLCFAGLGGGARPNLAGCAYSGLALFGLHFRTLQTIENPFTLIAA